MPKHWEPSAETPDYQTVQPDSTRPHLLERIAKQAARARLRPGKTQRLPAQMSVGTQGRANKCIQRHSNTSPQACQLLWALGRNDLTLD
jgi:hypothetical protein